MRRDTFVYRLFAADGTLLYVGMTKNLRQRRQNHARSKVWWAEVAAWKDVRAVGT